MSFASQQEKEASGPPPNETGKRWRKLNRGHRLTLRAEHLDHAGAGVARFEDVAIHVAGLLPGEEAEARVQHRSPHTADVWADLVTRRSAAPERVIPVCPGYGQCGGCMMQHLSYEAQRVWKRELLVRALVRAGVPVKEVPACVAAGEAEGLRYRNRSKLVAVQRGDRVVLGAYAPRSHEVVDMDGCRIVEPVLDRVAGGIATLWGQLGLSVYDEGTGLWGLRYVLLRDGVVQGRGQVQVSLVLGEIGELGPLRELAERLVAAHPEVSGVVLHENRAQGNVLLQAEPLGRATRLGPEDAGMNAQGPEDRVLFGEAAIWDDVGPVRLRISPRSFLQVNREVAARIYADVAEALAPQPGEALLDLYCGVGGIALCLWHRQRGLAAIVGVEENPAAVADAVAGAERAGVSAGQARFLCGDAAAVLGRMGDAAGQEGEIMARPTLVVLNPPRRGCDGEVLKRVAALGPRALAYVSCDPDTLARDLVFLQEHGYQVVRVTPYDMHPHTAHVEAVALLQRTTT